MAELTYLGGYPEPLKAQVQQLIAAGKLGEMLAKRYPETHLIQSDKALLAYTMELKNRYLKSSARQNRVLSAFCPQGRQTPDRAAKRRKKAVRTKPDRISNPNAQPANKSCCVFALAIAIASRTIA